MANIYTSADQLIGGTPLLELTNIEKQFDLKAKVLAKLEYFNPAGSGKHRHRRDCHSLQRGRIHHRKADRKV